jgi:cytochrome c-type biogenesis protein CcmH/NrfG
MDQAARKAALDEAATTLPANPAAAERTAGAVLRALPGDPNATLILASALRRQGRAGEAIAVLEPLLARFPNAHPAHYELGMALADLGEMTRAVEALRAATRLGPGNADAWRALGEALFDTGDTDGCEVAFDSYRLASIRDAKLKPAAAALCDRSPDEAERLLLIILGLDPKNVEGLCLLGESLTRLRRHTEAGAALETALELQPDNNEIRYRLARSLEHQRRRVEALAHLERLVERDPGNHRYRDLLATVVGLTGDFERSVALLEALLAEHDRRAKTWEDYGHALRIIGRSAEASAAYRRAVELDPDWVDGYLALANLKVSAFADAEIAAMRKLGDRSDLPPDARHGLAFALGQALEDRRDYAGAFASYAAGAAEMRAEFGYDPEQLAELAGRSIALFDTTFFAKRDGFGASAPDPIFILGLPRSGSTLVEQILGSHSAIEARWELPDMGHLAWELAGYPEEVAQLTAEKARSVGERYLDATRALRKLGRPFFTDKMPNNFLYLGFIHLVLPNAKIIDARRHPMAACFSSFKQKFAEGAAFSYGLADLGRFYQDYLAIMAHFDRVLPGRVHRVVYEDLVADTEGEVRRLLAYLGLEFEPACLAFHETQRAVRTVSSEQVRRPIYREGLEHWRNFEAWLGPLREALGPALETWRS